MENQEILKLIDRNKKILVVFIRVCLLLIILKLSFDLRDMLRFNAVWGGKSVSDMLFSLALNFLGYSIVCVLVFIVVLAVMGARFRSRAVKELRDQFARIIRSDFEWVWSVRPGIFSIDCQERFVLFSSGETGYVAIRINSDDILSTKIERDISFSTRTETTHSVDGWYGEGRSFSRSVSVQREGISLEITYKGSDNLPYVVVVPFGEDRISAERAQCMIQMFA